MIFRFALGLAVALALLEPAAFAADPGAPIRERFADPQITAELSEARAAAHEQARLLRPRVPRLVPGPGRFSPLAVWLRFQAGPRGTRRRRLAPRQFGVPAESLVLLKPTMQEDHGGEKVIDKASWQYNILAGWIRSGAIDDSAVNSEIGRLEIQPAELVFERAGQSAQLRVLAHWRDGAIEDVTDITRFRTNDDSVAKVDEQTGIVTAEGRGDTHIVAFYRQWRGGRRRDAAGERQGRPELSDHRRFDEGR